MEVSLYIKKPILPENPTPTLRFGRLTITPSDLIASVISDTEVGLIWGYRSIINVDFKIERKEEGGSWRSSYVLKYGI
jgi:hypothetical protein